MNRKENHKSGEAFEETQNEISVIVPAYNEEKAIYQSARQIVETLEKMDVQYEVILVDDGSTDNTGDEIRRAIKDFPNVQGVFIKENVGKGNALRRGFQHSKYENICMIDADLDLPPYQIGTLDQIMREKRADIVIGSKRHPQSRLNYPWYRKLYSTTYYFLILVMFGLPVKDTQTGIKIFSREVLERVFPRVVCKQYTLDLELLVVANRLGFKIAEAPVVLEFHKKYGHINWVDIRNIIVDTLAVFYRLYFLKYYDSFLLPAVDYEPRVTIVIPSRELDSNALQCIRKCCELNYGNYEIIFVPDEPVDHSVLPGIVRVIPGGGTSPSAKRNMASTSTDAELIALIDSDAYPDPDWLRNAIPYFQDENIAAVAGPAITPPGDSKRQQASGLIYSSSLVSGSTTFRYTFHSSRNVDDYPSCNFIVRRKDYIEIGGCLEEYWPGEDTVLCLKLTKERKKKILYIPNVFVYHHRRPVYSKHLSQVASYAWHRGYFSKKFPETSRRLQFFVPSVFVLFVICGLAPAILNSIIRLVYISVLSFYFLLVILSGIKSLDVIINLMIIPGIVTTHFTYGTMFMFGLISRGRKK
ncbi:MAG: glycosyltransferase [Actinomycetota bacterium]|nr:glycosyltransferase [Actinomycetota bacterium]